jgi:holliday junction DNA helicase RuvA
MIAHLVGSVARTEANSVVLDVNGVGYRVFVPLSVLTNLPPSGEKMMLFTTMSVREDDISLYGFRTQEELQVFQMATSVSGVGPKVALSMLSVLDGGELARAIAGSDARALTKIPGVGPKLAQRVILELGERMAELAFDRKVDALTSRQTQQENAAFEDIVEALVNLGYARADSRKAAERVLSGASDKTNTPALIREALNMLAGTGRR